jgi:hypothetical protein
MTDMLAPEVDLQQSYEVVAIDALQMHPDNPRRGDVATIVESIEAHGFYGAVIVQRSSMRVLAGNHRLLAARQQGITRLPAIFVDVDDDAAKRIMLVDNRTNDIAEYDDSALTALLRSLDGDLFGTGFDQDDLAELLAADDAMRLLDEDGAQERIDDDFPVHDRKRIGDAAFAYWLEHRDFPYRSLPLHEQMQQINRLAMSDDVVLRHSVACYQVADTYHPHRYDVRIPGKRNPVESFHDDRLLRIAIDLIIDSGMLVTRSTVLNALAMVRNTQAAANFRPAFALLMLRRFAPVGATVLDTSTGFGGRLLGYAASKCGAYIGIDPNRQTHDANAHG